MAVIIDGEFVIVNKRLAKSLWAFKEVEAFIKGRTRKVWRVIPNLEFDEWATRSLRGTYKIRRREFDPADIPNGQHELKLDQDAYERMRALYGSQSDLPTVLKRWTISFEEEADATLFRMKWL